MKQLWQKSGYRGVDALFSAVKDAGHKVTKAFVRDWLQEQKTYQVTAAHSTAPVVWANLPVPPCPFDTVQTDLVFIPKAWGWPSRRRYLLTAVDVHSRRAWAYPLTAKTQALDALKKVAADGGMPIKKLMVDQGTEFVNDALKKWIKAQGGELVLAVAKSGETAKFANQEMAFVERFHRTMKESLLRSMEESQEQWPDLLPQFLSSYNNTRHGGTGATPMQLWNKGCSDVKREKVSEKKIEAVADKARIQLGDFVRVRLAGKRSGEIRWSQRVYAVVQANWREPVTYRLDGRDGSYYARELQLAPPPASLTAPVKKEAAPPPTPKPRKPRAPRPVPAPRPPSTRTRKAPKRD